MHGMSAKEFAEFKALKVASRAAKTVADMKAVKAAVAAWVKSAKSEAAKTRRRNMARAVRGSHAEWSE